MSLDSGWDVGLLSDAQKKELTRRTLRMGRELREKIQDIKTKAKEKGWKEPYWLSGLVEIMEDWDRDMGKYRVIAAKQDVKGKQEAEQVELNEFRWEIYGSRSLPTTDTGRVSQRQSKLPDAQPTGTTEPV